MEKGTAYDYVSKLNINELFEELKTTKEVEKIYAEANGTVDEALEFIRKVASKSNDVMLLFAHNVIEEYVKGIREVIDCSIRDKKQALSEREDEIIQRGE